MIVWILQISIKQSDIYIYICHVVDVCSKMLKDFHDYCLFNMSDQLVVGIASGCF